MMKDNWYPECEKCKCGNLDKVYCEKCRDEELEETEIKCMGIIDKWSERTDVFVEDLKKQIYDCFERTRNEN